MPLNCVFFDDLFREIARIARENSVRNREEWNELVDEVVGGFVDMGELHPDQDIEGYKNDLGTLWFRFKKESYEEEVGPEEDMMVERYKSNDLDEFDTVENFKEVSRKEEEGF